MKLRTSISRADGISLLLIALVPAPPGAAIARADGTSERIALRDARPLFEMGDVLVAHGGLIAALTAALLGLPVDNWPALGGMGNASWTQLSGHTTDRSTDFDAIRWRVDVWNASAQVAGDVL